MLKLHCGVRMNLRQSSVKVALWCSHGLKAVQCFSCTEVFTWA